MKEAVKLISQQVEHALARRNASPFSRKIHSTDYASFGISALDALTSGLPVGAITEMVGPECSGRTTAALSVVAALIRSATVCAWIDVADALEPESAAAIGVDMARLLWVRCNGQMQARTRRPGVDTPIVPASRHTTVTSESVHGSGGGHHPRLEARNMPEAVGAMLKAHERLCDQQICGGKRSIGTPGAPNRSVSSRSVDREEQPNSDRLPARRGDNLALVPRCAEQSWRTARPLPNQHKPIKRSDLLGDFSAVLPRNQWQALDQGLRAADLLLHNGGFSSIVLDLGSIPPEIAWRIPLATWFRFRAACERTRTSLVLLTQHPCARSSAELVLRLKTGNIAAQGNVMTGVHYSATTERSRAESNLRVVSIRKQPHAEQPGQWTSEAVWA